jgi:hypothetical protein
VIIVWQEDEPGNRVRDRDLRKALVPEHRPNRDFQKPGCRHRCFDTLCEPQDLGCGKKLDRALAGMAKHSTRIAEVARASGVVGIQEGSLDGEHLPSVAHPREHGRSE